MGLVMMNWLVGLCDGYGNGNGNVAVAGMNGVVELMCQVCGTSGGFSVSVRVSAFKPLALFLCGGMISLFIYYMTLHEELLLSENMTLNRNACPPSVARLRSSLLS
ncbi:hypothetical protein Tco_1510968 [Tanacetum coccineum]